MKSHRVVKKNFVQKYYRQLLIVILLTIGVVATSFAGNKVVTLFTQAAPIPANLVVDVSKTKGKLVRTWSGLSQGGEMDTNGSLVSLSPVIPQIQALGVKYIRLDHVLERPYKSRVLEIVRAGAIPIIALSYFPGDVATSDVGTVTNWDAWRNKVRALIEEVSGKNNMNLSGVYFEVWNEPDGEGFGKFDIGEGKDYFELYKQTVSAALTAKNVNSFKIGGPALADIRRCTSGTILGCQKYWLDQFLNLVAANKTRLDFISWHRYSTKIADYNEDVNFITSLYTKYASLPPAEKIITEWGSIPSRDPIHSSVTDGAHLVAAARTFVGAINLSTKFEVRDGPSAGTDGWGILTYGGSPKPSYQALKYLESLRDERVQLSGEGNRVTGIASRDSSGLTVILSNFDHANSYIEKDVPLNVTNLTPGKYRLTKSVIDASHPLGSEKVEVLSILKGNFKTTQTMFPNSVVLFDFQLMGLIPQ